MKKIIIKITNIFQSKLFRKWFFPLLVSYACLIVAFTSYIYIYFKKNLQSEFTSYSKLMTERVADSIDDSIDDARQIMFSLEAESRTTIFMHQKNSIDIFSDTYTRLFTSMRAYKQALGYMDSIYVYSPTSQTIMTNANLVPYDAASFSDTNWLDTLETSDVEQYVIMARKKNDQYPYLLTMMKPVQTASGTGGIIVNLNLSQLSMLSSYHSNLNQFVYLITDDGKILYRDKQEEILESLDTIDELSNFDNSQPTVYSFIAVDTPYVYAQQHSEHYPWYYVIITYTSEYSARMTNISSTITIFLIGIFGAVLILTFFFILISTSPLRIISQYLEMPVEDELMNVNDPEVEKIVQQIMTYIRMNQTLSDELKRQIDLQNDATLLALQSQINPHFLFNTLNMIRTREIENLGYDHPVPTLTLNLSRLLKYALNSTDLVAMETEFYYTELYLEIINERYQKKLHFDLFIDERLIDARIPKLIIQPLVENAVFHGCSCCIETSNHITISATPSGNNCILTIADDGVGIPSEKLEQLKVELQNIEHTPSESIGLHNTILRMHLLFGSSFKADIQSTVNQGTMIRLIFPILES